MRIIEQYKGLRRENYILVFGRLVTNLGSMIWPMLTMILNQKMGFDASTVAAVMLVAAACMLPANLIGGKLADKYNKKMIIVYSDLVSIACYILCGLIPLSWWSILLMLIAAVFQQMEDPAYVALVADLTPTDRREHAASLMYLGANLGLVLSPTIAGILFQNLLWLSFIINGVAIACSTALIFFGMKDISPVREDDEKAVYQRAEEKASLFRILKDNKIVALFILCMGFYFAAYQQYGYLMPLDLVRVHGDQGALIYGTVASINCIVVVIFTPLFTALTAKRTNMTKFLIGELLLAFGFGIFLLFIGHIPTYYIAILIFTWGEIFTTIAYTPYMSKRVPSSHRGRVEGACSFVIIAAGALSQLLTGGLFDRFGSAAAWTAAIVFVLIAVAGTVILMPLDRKRYHALYKDFEDEKRRKQLPNDPGED